jgi:hypothetical protein
MAAATASAATSATGTAAEPNLIVDTTAVQRGEHPALFGEAYQGTNPAVPASDDVHALYGIESSETLGENNPSYSGGAGAWPGLPSSGTGKRVAFRGVSDGAPQGYKAVPPMGPKQVPGTFNHDLGDMQTYDYVSYSKDSAGWNQYQPNNRIAHRSMFGLANWGNNPTWYQSAENTVKARLAFLGKAFTTPQNPDPFVQTPNGALPDWTVQTPDGYQYTAPSGPQPISVPDYQVTSSYGEDG